MNKKERKDTYIYQNIINELTNKISFYIKENRILNAKIHDMETTLDINKSILMSIIEKPTTWTQEQLIFQKMIKDNNDLRIKNESLQKEKNEFEKKLYNIQEKINSRPNKIRDELSQKSQRIFELENTVSKQSYIITHLKLELEKYYKGDFISQRELLIGDPNLINTEINSELIETRELFNKYSILLKIEKEKVSELREKIKYLENYITNKKKCKKIAKKFENIQMIEYLPSPDEESSQRSQINSPEFDFPPKNNQLIKLLTETSNIKEHSPYKTISSVNIPKLNLSAVCKNYKPIKVGDIVEKTNERNIGVDQDYEEKLKYQRDYYKHQANKNKKKVKELKKIVDIFKKHYKNEENALIISKLNNNSLTTSTTEERKKAHSAKSDLCDSMQNNANITVLFDEGSFIESSYMSKGNNDFIEEDNCSGKKGIILEEFVPQIKEYI